jgi:hypothetical protein
MMEVLPKQIPAVIAETNAPLSQILNNGEMKRDKTHFELSAPGVIVCAPVT